MTSAIDICNSALARIGKSANISSLDPPESDPHAEACSIFFPLAKAEILEAFPWSFAVKRDTVALLAEKPLGYAYAYRLPSDCVRVLSLLKSCNGAESSDYPYSTVISEAEYGFPFHGRGDERWDVETIDGLPALVTQVDVDAVRYISSRTDAGAFSPSAAEALSWLTAAKIAGPILRGDGGASVAKSCLQSYAIAMQQAVTFDLQRQNKILFYRSPFVGDFIGGLHA